MAAAPAQHLVVQHLVADDASQSSASSAGHMPGIEAEDNPEPLSYEHPHNDDVVTGESMEHQTLLQTVPQAQPNSEPQAAAMAGLSNGQAAHPMSAGVTTPIGVPTTPPSIGNPASTLHSSPQHPTVPITASPNGDLVENGTTMSFFAGNISMESLSAISPNGELQTSVENGTTMSSFARNISKSGLFGTDTPQVSDRHEMSRSQSRDTVNSTQHVEQIRALASPAPYSFHVPLSRSMYNPTYFPSVDDGSMYDQATSGFHERGLSTLKENRRNVLVIDLKEYERILKTECRQKTEAGSNGDDQSFNDDLLKIYTERQQVRTAIINLSGTSMKDMEMGEIVHNMGILSVKLNKVQDGITFLQMAHEYFKPLHHTREKAASIDELLGDAYMQHTESDKLKKASHHYDRALEMFRKVKDAKALVRCYGKQARLLSQMKMFEKAIKVRQRALKLIEEHSKNQTEIVDADTKGGILMAMGKDSARAKRRDVAEEKYRQAIEIWSESKTVFSKEQSAECRKQIGLLLMEDSRPKAKEEFLKAIELYDAVHPDGSHTTVDLLVRLTQVVEPADRPAYFRRSWSMADDLAGSLETAPLITLLESFYEIVKGDDDIILAKKILEKLEDMTGGRTIDCNGRARLLDFVTELAQWFKKHGHTDAAIKSWEVARVCQADLSGRDIINIDSEITGLQTSTEKKEYTDRVTGSQSHYWFIVSILIVILAILVIILYPWLFGK